MRPLFCAGFLLLIMACTQQSVQIQYYQFPYPEVLPQAEAATHPERVLVLQGIQLAPFLQQRGIAFQQSETELTVARQHLWADDLATQLSRHLRLNLDAKYAGWQVQQHPDKAAVQLHIQLDRMLGTADGYALLSGEYRLSRQQHSKRQRFLIQQPLQGDGYPALVQAMAEGWQQLSHDITQQLEAF
ncbi:ABC-type transport auxiliary lipoprotein family protein [Alkalimonas sp.]|uniref:PqiC family protein n=1 Tax=Alkalimonas sp. TaxID=1872453 RepID=UPI00263B1ABA|nr:ABC-type transport auxiliary lipoprotein family protein [Alkalimonas sp.]MCC5827580.1 membrane integrity-associated transporter subunit PqiC [Alkalimonas sp.]